MSYKNVLVVGAGIAGIAGIIAAYFEAKKGNNVTLIESDARAGGLLKILPSYLPSETLPLPIIPCNPY